MCEWRADGHALSQAYHKDINECDIRLEYLAQAVVASIFLNLN